MNFLNNLFNIKRKPNVDIIIEERTPEVKTKIITLLDRLLHSKNLEASGITREFTSVPDYAKVIVTASFPTRLGTRFVHIAYSHAKTEVFSFNESSSINNPIFTIDLNFETVYVKEGLDITSEQILVCLDELISLLEEPFSESIKHQKREERLRKELFEY